MPQISIIVPVYNIQDYLEECLESLAAQTYEGFEVLCVIDGSTDGSEAIACGFADKDARFKVLAKSNGGLSSARNFGIDHARGDYLLFVDGDDRLRPDCCEAVVRAFAHTGAQALVFGANAFPADRGTPWHERTLTPPTRTWASFAPELMFAPYATPFAWRNAVQREAFLQSGVRFNESLPFAEDVVFQFQLYPRLDRIATIADKLYDYRLKREGSLMDVHDDVLKRLHSHQQIVQAVFRDWEKLGLVRPCSRQLFEWSVPYLTEEIAQLPFDDRLSLMTSANKLWNQAFDGCSLPRIKLRKKGLCRGEGKLYVLVNVEAPMPFLRLYCGAQVNGNAVPASAYPLEAGSIPMCTRWVLELPQIESGSITVACLPDGRESQVATISIDAAKARWESKANYLLRRRRSKLIRDIEQGFLLHRYQCRITQRFDGADGALWRCETRWIGEAAQQPEFKLSGLDGRPLPSKAFFCELQEGNEALGRENVLTVSLRTPATCDGFIVQAVPSRSGCYRAGFTSVGPSEAAVMEAATADLMLDAGDEPRAYVQWLRRHRADERTLLAGHLEDVGAGPRIALFLWAAGSPDPAALARTIASLEAQSCSDWTLTIAANPQRLELTPHDMRITIADASGQPVAPWLQERAASQDADVVGFLHPGDQLEPDALHWFVHAMRESGFKGNKVWYCDQDAMQPDGSFGQPTFKSPLDIDALYSHNQIGQLALFTRDLIVQASQTSAADFSSWLYEQTLSALRKDARFIHLPQMLFHEHVATAPYLTGERTASDQAQMQVLQRHLDAMEIAGEVVAGATSRTWRVSYTLPLPKPLVSIIIPNKDRIDLLKPCLQSLLHNTNYGSIEVIVVENNSTEQETFDFYDMIQRGKQGVKVVKWPGAFNYSKIINFGASHATGDYLLLLNNDTEVIASDFIQEMLGPLQRPDCAVVGAKLLFRDGLVQHAGVTVGTWGAVVHVNQFFTPERGGYLAKAILPGQFTAVTGACQMVRKSVFDELGGYDEGFAVGFNDVDFCMRARKAGYTIALAPDAVLHHYEFSTRGREEGNQEKMARWRDELERFKQRWPEPFEQGDPCTNPNLMRDNTYYRLGD